MTRFGFLIVFGSVAMLIPGCTTTDSPKPEPVTSGPATTSSGVAGSGDTVAPGVVPAPVWRVGSQWKYSDGYGLRVARVNGDVTLFTRTDTPGRWLSRRGFLREASQSGTALRRIVYRTVQPAAGKSLKLGHPLVFHREYIANDKLRVHVTSWTVEGRERIAVPAGEFDTWVVVMRTRSLKTDWTGFERWWYSPKARNYVRLEYKYGEGQESSRVLMSYSLSGDLG